MGEHGTDFYYFRAKLLTGQRYFFQSNPAFFLNYPFCAIFYIQIIIVTKTKTPFFGLFLILVYGIKTRIDRNSNVELWS